jgi:hypothetical protein
MRGEIFPPHKPLQKIKKQTNTTGGKACLPVGLGEKPQRSDFEF